MSMKLAVTKTFQPLSMMYFFEIQCYYNILEINSCVSKVRNISSIVLVVLEFDAFNTP